MSTGRKNRRAFRPTLEGAPLEDRQVLAGGVSTVFNLGSGVTAVIPPTPASASTLGGSLATQANRQAMLQNLQSIRQFRSAFLQQARAASGDLQRVINTQAAQLFADGTPTSQDLATFNAFVNGALNATTFRLSSQAALLPNSADRLVGGIQNRMLGSGQTSLLKQIQSQALVSRNTGSLQSLQNAIAQEVNRTFAGVNNQFNTFFSTTPLARLSVDQTTGQRIPFQQFLGNQVVNQFGNTLASLSQSFPTVGSSMLFPNGATTATLDAQRAFVNQFQQALGTTAFQLGSNLSLFQGANATLTPTLQTALFGTDVTNPGLFGLLSNLPVDSVDFPTATSGLFSGNFADIISPLNTFFGLPTSQNVTLPNTNITGVFGPTFTSTNFNSGFNNGFGSGFIGFGVAPSGFDSNFGSGFSSLINGANSNFGFAPPSLGSGFGTGFGTTGVGSGTTGIDTGTTGTTGIGTGGGTTGIF